MASKFETPGQTPLPKASYPWASPWDEYVHNPQVSTLAEVAKRWRISYDSVRQVAKVNGWADQRAQTFESRAVIDGPSGLKIKHEDYERAVNLTRDYEAGRISDEELRSRLQPVLLRGLLAHAVSEDAQTSRLALAELLSMSMSKPTELTETVHRWLDRSPGELRDAMQAILSGTDEPVWINETEQ